MTGPSRGPRVPVGGDGRPVGRDAALVAALAAYQDSVMRLRALDPVVTEVVRLRCARQHDCRICQTLRLADAAIEGADDSLTSKIDFYERSDLEERLKVALRITDAFIWQPASISPALARQAHEYFSEAELAEMLMDITKWSTQKIHVALGTDGAERLPVNESGIAYLRFADDGSVAPVTSSL